MITQTWLKKNTLKLAEDGHFVGMPVQLLRQVSAMVICPNGADPRPPTRRSSSLTSSAQAAHPSFHFYDFASAALSPVMFQEKTLWEVWQVTRANNRGRLYTPTPWFPDLTLGNSLRFNDRLGPRLSLRINHSDTEQSIIQPLPPSRSSAVITGWAYGFFHRTWFLLIVGLGNV